MNQLSIESKEEGNKAFRAKDYHTAIRHYTTSINHDNTDPVLYSNRAQCYLNIKNYEEAYNDTVTGLDLCQKHSMSTPSVIVKLLFRKAMALKGQNKMDFAKKAFEDVLAVDPSNAHALSELAIFEQEGKRDSGDIKIPVEVVDELPDRFKKMLNTESQQLPKQEKKVSSGDVDKEIDELFGSKTAKVNHKEIPKVEEVKVHEKSPMHFLTALKQLPEEQKVKGYLYVLNLDAESYEAVFSSGIDTEFLQFYLDAVNYVARNETILPNWNNISLNHLQQFSTFKRYDLAILMCDDNVKKSILEIVRQKYPQDFSNYEKYLII